MPSLPPSLAIVGGGFSGSMLAMQLVRQAQAPVTILLFEASGEFAKGAAYGTRDLLHLLNVPAAKMSAFPDAPTHLVDWLKEKETSWRAVFPRLANIKYDATSFLPRALYGFYLASLWEEAKKEAEEKNIALRCVAAQVILASYAQDWSVTTSEGVSYRAQLLALATGNPPARDFPRIGEASDARYIPHLWSPAGQAFLHTADVAHAAKPVVILGTGLTAVDAVLSLATRQLPVPMVLISRHAKFPLPHAALPQTWTAMSEYAKTPRLAGRLRALRHDIREAASQGTGWEAVIDALRPRTASLWQSLPPQMQQRFLHRLWNMWNIHRHRMPRSSYMALAGLVDAGKLQLLAGRIDRIDATQPDCLTLHWRNQRGETQTLQASYVVNCTGPELELSRIANPLLRDLAEQGALRPHPLGIGAGLARDGSLAGNAQGRLYAIGPLLIGEYLETTAVPELRAQAQVLAATLLSRLKDCQP